MLFVGTAFAFIFGTIIGSFSNVIIFRYGFREARRARSGCVACGKTLAWYELVPIVSFFLLRQKCGRCGSAISFQYPLVEVTVGILFGVTFFLMYPFISFLEILFFLLTLIFWTVFVVLVVYDMRHTLVPYSFSLALIGTSILFRVIEGVVFQTPIIFLDAIIGGALFSGFLLIIYLFTRGKGMGLGDVYVALGLGIMFGASEALDILMLSFWIGAVFGIAILILKKRFTMKSEVPFVPFLFLATIIVAFTDFSPILFIGALY